MKFNNLFSDVKNLFDGGKKEEAKKALMDAFDKAAADGDITAEEMAEINKMQKELGVKDEEFNAIKVKVLESLLAKITKDGVISDEEQKLFNEIKGDLAIKEIDEEANKPENKNNPDFLKKSIGVLMNVYGKAKNGTLKGVNYMSDKIKGALSDKDKNKDEQNQGGKPPKV